MAIGLFLDLTGMILAIRRIYGEGPSGIPIIPGVLYIIAAFLVDIPVPFIIRLLVGIAIHVFLQYGVIWIIQRMKTS